MVHFRRTMAELAETSGASQSAAHGLILCAERKLENETRE